MVESVSSQASDLWVTHLHSDLDLAVRYPVPLLITGPADVASSIVQTIAARARIEAADVVVWDLDRRDEFLSADRAERALTRARVLWLKNVDRSTRLQQAAFVHLIAGGFPNSLRLRLIASATTDLLARVRVGAFDRTLFYRLNTLHIVWPAWVGDRRANRR
jgi:hypothetical protein